MLNKLLTSALMLAALTTTNLALTQEQETSAETSTPPNADEAEADNRPEPVPVNSDEPPSRFIPTEDISEDFSVSFPVDI